MEYRLYLLDGRDSIQAAEWFTANDDAEAAQIGAEICNAGSDVFFSCELWCGTRRIAVLRPAPQAGPIANRTVDNAFFAARQERTIELEDRLQRSFDCVRSSHQLMESFAKLARRS